MKKVYVASIFSEGLRVPQIYIFGGRNMAERFIKQIMDDHGIASDDIRVKQYVVMTDNQLKGHYGEKRDS